MSSASTRLPSSLRSRFSSRILSENGRRPTSATSSSACSRQISHERPATSRPAFAPKLFPAISRPPGLTRWSGRTRAGSPRRASAAHRLAPEVTRAAGRYDELRLQHDPVSRPPLGTAVALPAGQSSELAPQERVAATTAVALPAGQSSELAPQERVAATTAVALPAGQSSELAPQERVAATTAVALPAGQSSDVEADVEDVALADDVGAAFGAEEALGAGGVPAPGGDHVVVGDHLGADEAAFEVGVDAAGG